MGAEEARFRLFDGITAFLKRVAKQQPLMLIFDDLQRSDTPSVRVLEFLVRELTDAPMLVVGTYRDVEVGPEHPLFSTLGELGREPSTQRVALRGLSRNEIGQYMALTVGFEPPPALVEAVFQETEGNPFFVGEMVRVLAAEGRMTETPGARPGRPTIPQSVHEAIVRRLQGLSSSCDELLTLAAVVGREFGLNVLERALGCNVLPAVDEAIGARVIQETEGTGRYRFVHVLIREVLYQQLTTPERVRMHRQVGETLESLYQLYPEPYLTELAYHFVSAAPGGEREKAIDYAVKAGSRAAAQMAHEEAARHYEMALQVLELTESADGRRLCELLLLLSEARWRGGESGRAKETSLRAAEVARKLGAADQLARAALEFAGPLAFGIARYDETAISLLDEALAALPPEDPPLQARVMARLAEEIGLKDPGNRRWDLCRKAVEVARGSGDPRLLASVLRSVYFPRWVSPQEVETRLAVAGEIGQLAVQIGDRSLEFEGLIFRVLALMELGDIVAVHAALRICDRLTQELRQPYYRWFLASARVVLAFIEGRLADVEGLAQEALRLGQQAQNNNAPIYFGAQLGHLFYLRGQFEEMALMVSGIADTFPLQLDAMRYSSAAICAEQGDEVRARCQFQRLAAQGFSDVPLSLMRLHDLCVLALTCAFLGDRVAAERLYELLLPAEGRNTVVGVSFASGSSSHYLGLLAATMGRQQDAARHFEDALAMNSRMGTRQWVARTQVAYADLLLKRGHAGDAAQAWNLLEAAERTAQELRMSTVAAKVAALKTRAADSPAASDAAGASVMAAKEGGRGIFRREGEFWTVAYSGTVCRLKDAKGLRYIAHLLRHPGREVHVMELIAATVGLPAGYDRSAAYMIEGTSIVWGAGDAGPILDAEAIAVYRRRRTELESEIDEAERLQDIGRATAWRREYDLITEQLATAARGRRAASAAERARLAVTKGIRAAVKRIREGHPACGQHFAIHIRTGYLCSYTPSVEQPIRWDL